MSSKVALALCLLFVCLAIPWIGRPGMQTDETLFASAIYPPIAENLVIRLFDREIPLMTMSYVGALKSYLWAGLFQIWHPSPASVRVPAVVLGGLSVWWMYGLLRRTVGTHAALAGAALLATDPLYILYSRWAVFAVGSRSGGAAASVLAGSDAGVGAIPRGPEMAGARLLRAGIGGVGEGGVRVVDWRLGSGGNDCFFTVRFARR